VVRLCSLDCRGSIPIWSYLRCHCTLLLSVEAGSGTGIASAFTDWPVLGMMRMDRIRGALIVVAEFPGAILCRCEALLQINPILSQPTTNAEYLV